VARRRERRRALPAPALTLPWHDGRSSQPLNLPLHDGVRPREVKGFGTKQAGAVEDVAGSLDDIFP
jgi:hypothetical protein